MPSYWMFCVLEFVHLPVVSSSIYFPFFCFFCWNFLKWDWMVLAAFSTSTGLRGGTGEAHVPLQALDSEQDRKQGIAREATAVEVRSAATIKVQTHAKHWSFCCCCLFWSISELDSTLDVIQTISETSSAVTWMRILTLSVHSYAVPP